jgi:quinol monooxygenase YgiN
MLVLYVAFELEGSGDDRDAAFRRWLADAAATTRQVEGCVRYDCLLDLDARRGVIVEVWSSAAAREPYLLMPHHVEMVAWSTSKWGMHSFRTMSWADAGQPALSVRERSDEPAAGRPEMDRLVTTYLATTGDDIRVAR